MSGRSTSENQPAPASSSSDADDTRPGSGAILGGVLLVGAAAGYALIAFRFKNMHAGIRGSGSAEVGCGTPSALSCTLCATFACTSHSTRITVALLNPLVRHLCASLTAPLQMRAADIFSKQASRAANTDWSAEARAAARAAETEAVTAACHLVAPPLTTATLRTLPPRRHPKGLSSRDASACGLLSALVRSARGCIDAPVSARGVSTGRAGPRPRAPATHRCDGACVAATPALPHATCVAARHLRRCHLPAITCCHPGRRGRTAVHRIARGGGAKA